jgi:hypothetical protein
MKPTVFSVELPPRSQTRGAKKSDPYSPLQAVGDLAERHLPAGPGWHRAPLHVPFASLHLRLPSCDGLSHECHNAQELTTTEQDSSLA